MAGGGAGTKRPRAAGGKAAAGAKPDKPVAGREGLTVHADGASTFFASRPFAASEASRIFLALKAGSEGSRWKQQDLVVMGKKVRAPRGGRAARGGTGPLSPDSGCRCSRTVQVKEPRLVRYQGEIASAALSYKYSGVTVMPTPFEPVVRDVLAKLHALLPDDGPGLKLPPFNTCLMNYYRSGACPASCACTRSRRLPAAHALALLAPLTVLGFVCTDVLHDAVPLPHAPAGDDSLSWHDDFDAARYGEDPVIASVSFGAERIFRLRRKADTAEQVDFTLGAGAILVMAGTCQKTWQHCVPKRAKTPTERINLTFRYVVNA